MKKGREEQKERREGGVRCEREGRERSEIESERSNGRNCDNKGGMTHDPNEKD